MTNHLIKIWLKVIRVFLIIIFLYPLIHIILAPSSAAEESKTILFALVMALDLIVTSALVLLWLYLKSHRSEITRWFSAQVHHHPNLTKTKR